MHFAPMDSIIAGHNLGYTPAIGLQNLQVQAQSRLPALVRIPGPYFTCKAKAIKGLLVWKTSISHGDVKGRCTALVKENPSQVEKTETDIRKKQLAVFVSGSGSNFRSIHQATLESSINGDIVVLVTDKPGCGGAEYARSKNIPVVVFPKSKLSPEGLSTQDLVTFLRKLMVDVLLLAGYLKLIPVELVQAFPRSILNIHPSLLPAFGGKGYYGLKVHQAVISSGARFSGPTVHFVDEHYDTGRTLAQRVVPVLADDTPERLAERVLHEEHRVYVDAVAALCEDRVVWRDDGVPLIRSRTNPSEFS